MLSRPIDDTGDILPVLTSADLLPAYPLLLQAFGIRCILSGGLGERTRIWETKSWICCCLYGKRQ